jgi:hypothetical protein
VAERFDGRGGQTTSMTWRLSTRGWPAGAKQYEFLVSPRL